MSKIIAKMATHPPRLKTIYSTLNSLIPQVDEIQIYFNQCSHLPELKEIQNICGNEKLTCFLSEKQYGDLGDTGKTFKISEVPEYSTIFLVDDDIIYPKNYVYRMVKTLNWFGGVIGVHGCKLKTPLRNYFRDRTVYHFSTELREHLLVDVLGTGTVCMSAETAKDALDNVYVKNMLDLFLAVSAKQKSIPLTCISREPRWLLQSVKDESSIWATRDKTASKETNFLKKVFS